MRYTSDVQDRVAPPAALGFPWAAAIPAAASVASGIIGLISGDRQRDYAEKQAEQEQHLQLLSQQAQAEVARLQQTLPGQLTEHQAQRILQTGAEAERQQALQTWRDRFSGLPNAMQLAEHVASQIQNTYLSAAQQVQGRSALKKGAGWLLLATGASLGAYTLYQKTRN